VPDPKEIVLNYENALNSGDWGTARSYLDDNLRAGGPLATYDNADSFIEAMKRRHPMIKKVDMRKVFAEGQDVCILYDVTTVIPNAPISFTAEWCHVRDDKINSILVVFDPRYFESMIKKRLRQK
jgi:hypothetical protein